MKIAIKRLMGLGDVIISEPLISHFKQSYPDSHLTYITSQNRGCRDILAYVDGIDDIQTVEPGQGLGAKLLKEGGFDLAFDLDRAIPQPGKSYFQSYTDLCDLPYDSIDRKVPQLRYEGPAKITEDYVVISPEASGWKGKEWPLHHFAQLAKRLTRQGITVVEPGAQKYVFQSDYQNIERNMDLALNWIKHARLFIGGDCGLMHVAAALGVPCVINVGSVFPQLTTEACSRQPFELVHVQDLPCLGCVHNHYLSLNQPECIHTRHFGCTRDLSVDAMYAAVCRMLDRDVKKTA
ncbi:glycosyltransferase family 9 protein [Rhodovibrionaceae bacterium A322]